MNEKDNLTIAHARLAEEGEYQTKTPEAHSQFWLEANIFVADFFCFHVGEPLISISDKFVCLW